MTFFEKPLDQITVADLEWLRAAGVEEGPEVEFKSRLSAESGEADPWEAGGEKIGRLAIAALVKELVAFANEQGGTLILGLEETSDKPPRAGAIAPVPRALELAERLQQRCRDNFDPPVFGLQAKGIATDSNGSGVVVMKVPTSPYGPHRSRSDLQSYRRVNDQSVPMTMDQIHRQVIELARRTQQADAWFIEHTPQPIPTGALGFILRAVARPSAPLLLPKLHRLGRARPVLTDIPVLTRDGVPFENAFVVASWLDWRPIVRGTTASATSAERTFRYNGWENGGLWMDFRKIVHGQVKHPNISLNWIVGLFGNMLLAVERFRLSAQLPLPYEAEFHLLCSAGFHREFYNERGAEPDPLPPGLHTLGRYPIGDSDTFDSLTRLFETDVYHLSGRDNPDQTAFDYGTALARIREAFGAT